jgi:hypothetical protein
VYVSAIDRVLSCQQSQQSATIKVPTKPNDILVYPEGERFERGEATPRRSRHHSESQSCDSASDDQQRRSSRKAAVQQSALDHPSAGIGGCEADAMRSRSPSRTIRVKSFLKHKQKIDSNVVERAIRERSNDRSYMK